MSIDPMPGTTIAFPFEILNGSVVSQTDPESILRSRIVFLISSQVGERVMRPDWGIDIMNSYLSLGAELQDAVAEAVEEGLRNWFPGIIVKSLSVIRNTTNPNMVNIDLLYGVDEGSNDELARIPVLLSGGFDSPVSEGAL